ncbi:PorV/PorQ family protein [Bacteroidota bacterium]
MMLKRVYLKIILMILFASVALSQSTTKTGSTAAQFLKIGVGPRAVGMGSAFTATSNDLTAIYWNPAGLAGSYSYEAFFNHVNWVADISYDFAGVSAHLSGIGTIGAFVTILQSIDGMLVRTVDNPEGSGEKFDAGAIAIGLSFARNLTENFSIGFNVKYIREYIWNESAIGVGLDAGVLYKIPILNELRLAASISNFGSKMQLDGRDILEIKQVGEGGEGNLINSKIEMQEWELPLLFRVGVAADIFKSESSRLTTAIDAIHPNDHTEYVNLGAEYCWNELISLRAGYNSLFEENTEEGLTLGVGLNYRLIESVRVLLDYAYKDFGRLNSVHYFSVGVKF